MHLISVLFSSAVRAKQTGNLSGFERKRHILKHRAVSIRFTEMTNVQFHHLLLPSEGGCFLTRKIQEPAFHAKTFQQSVFAASLFCPARVSGLSQTSLSAGTPCFNQALTLQPGQRFLNSIDICPAFECNFPNGRQLIARGEFSPNDGAFENRSQLQIYRRVVSKMNSP